MALALTPEGEGRPHEGDSPSADTPRFGFEYPGSLQGFMIHPGKGLAGGIRSISNAGDSLGFPGLRIDYTYLGPGMIASVAVETFTDLMPRGGDGTSYFEVLASPALYGTQILTAELQCLTDDNPEGALYIEYYTDGGPACERCAFQPLGKGCTRLSWRLPDTGGFPIFRTGVELRSARRLDGTVVLRSMDWKGAPGRFVLGKSLAMSPALTPWTTDTVWLKTFMSSAKNFYPDYTATFSLSHPAENGVVTIGSANWKDYSVASTLTFMQQQGAGLILRSRGHRRYYGAIIAGSRGQIIKRKDGDVMVLAEYDGAYRIDSRHKICFSAVGTRLSMSVDEVLILEANDTAYDSGAAGFMVNTGAVLIDEMIVAAADGNKKE
jgi:hypothetical protein